MANNKQRKKPGELETTKRSQGLGPLGDFRELMEGLRHDIDELFRNMGPRWAVPEWALRPFGAWRVPRVDLEDRGNEYRLRAELPGIPRDRVNVNVTPDRLEVKAEAATEKEEKAEGRYYRESGRRSFYRSLPLPSDADPDKVEARMQDGCLEVSIGKKIVSVKSRSVSVK